MVREASSACELFRAALTFEDMCNGHTSPKKRHYENRGQMDILMPNGCRFAQLTKARSASCSYTCLRGLNPLAQGIRLHASLSTRDQGHTSTMPRDAVGHLLAYAGGEGWTLPNRWKTLLRRRSWLIGCIFCVALPCPQRNCFPS